MYDLRTERSIMLGDIAKVSKTKSNDMKQHGIISSGPDVQGTPVNGGTSFNQQSTPTRPSAKPAGKQFKKPKGTRF
jgi:hypothetical protein